MVISPNSDIILYSGMPLDDTYTDTLYFSSLSAQTSFFTGGNAYEKRRFNVNTYQRVNEGIFDAQCLADEIYDCNYLAFRNTNFGNKWFYGFITQIEYVNNGMARVYFTLDVIQTYFFDAELEYCLVEREHSDSDVIGWNIVPEPITTGEYVFEDYGGNDYLAEPMIVLGLASVDDDEGGFTASDGNLIDGIYSGLDLQLYHANQAGVQAINSTISTLIMHPDAIVLMYMAPLLASPVFNDGDSIVYSATGRSSTETFNDKKPAAHVSGGGKYMIGDYVIKNNKLLTYPYSYFHVDDGNGGSLVLRYEFFDNFTPVLEYTFTVASPAQVSCRPVNYKGVSGGAELMTESLSLSGFPMCSWNYDSFKAWIAQNAVPMAIKGAGAAIGAIQSRNPAGLVQTGLNMATDIYMASIQADACRGSISNANVNFSNRKQTIYTARAHLNEQELRVIDDFFSKYGYACNRIKLPNRSYRPHWNYVKTNGCTVIGECPADAIKQICSIYDNGITFWKNANEVGNYSLDNSPV